MDYELRSGKVALFEYLLLETGKSASAAGVYVVAKLLLEQEPATRKTMHLARIPVVQLCLTTFHRHLIRFSAQHETDFVSPKLCETSFFRMTR